MTDHRRNEFCELIAAMREGVIDSDGIARIEALARESSELCRLYIEHVRLAADLRLDYDAKFIERSLARTLRDQADDEPNSGCLDTSNKSSKKSPIIGFLGDIFPSGQNQFPHLPGILMILAIALPAILLGVLAARPLWRNEAGESVAVAPAAGDEKTVSSSPRSSISEPIYVARLTKLVDCVWADAKRPAQSGLLLHGGERLDLKEGRVEISFFDGARLVAQGPTVLEPKSPDSAVLHSGTVRVRADADAIGFTLLTPRVAVVDMGTEFGVSVDNTGRANVDVFEGQVIAQVMDSSGIVRENISITEGRAIRFDEKTQAMQSHPDGNFKEVVMDELPSGYQLWLPYSESLAQDPDMVAYYTFEGRQSGDDVLQNHSLRGSLLDGQIVNARWVEGRWPNKGALEFKDIADRVLIDLPGEYEELSIAAWVRLDESARKPASLLHSDGHIWDNPGVIHWMINPLQSIHFAFVDADKRITNCFSGAAITSDGSPRWHHFAVVCDMRAGTVTQYVDGCVSGNQTIERPRPLRIGSAQIGNSSIDKPLDDRHLAGLIDELMIFQRALSAAEIRYMHAIGRPAD